MKTKTKLFCLSPLLWFAVGLLPFFSLAPLAFSQGTAFTYQGRLADGTNPANGNYGMLFYLCDTPDTGGQLANVGIVNVPVSSNGLFTVTLDFGANFPGADRWLEITVKTNGAATFTTLTPRQKLTPTPYAIHAGNAKTFDGHGTNDFAPATGSANYVAKSGDTMTGPLEVPSPLVVANSSIPSRRFSLEYRGDAVARFKVNGGDPIAISQAGGDALTVDSAGRVGIGTTTPTTKLQVVGPDAVQGTGWKSEFFSGYAGNYLSQRIGFGYDAANSTTFGAAIMTQGTTRLWVGNDGNVGIGTSDPSTKLWVEDSGGLSGTRIAIKDSDANGRQWHLVNGGSSIQGVGKFSIRDGTVGANRLTIDTSGNVGIGTTAPMDKLQVEGNIRGHRISVHGAGGDSGLEPDYFAIYQESGAWEAPYPDLRIQYHTGIKYDAYHGYGGHRFYTDYDGTGNPAGLQMQITDKVYIAGNLGIGTPDPQEKLHVNGTARVNVLTITGGADVAEPFEMSAEIPKGSVMIIDDEHPGRLKLSEHAYDSRVAGIVSGAGGVKPGLTLTQEGALPSGQNVALTGRVYALADATAAPIKPGDLLTTSATPGHCMKATDRERAHGAILGKAMSSLKEGKGLVLVLVSLQ